MLPRRTSVIRRVHCVRNAVQVGNDKLIIGTSTIESWVVTYGTARRSRRGVQVSELLITDLNTTRFNMIMYKQPSLTRVARTKN